MQEHSYTPRKTKPEVKVRSTRAWAQFAPNLTTPLVQKPLEPEEPQRNLSFTLWPVQGAPSRVHMSISAIDHLGNPCSRDLVLTRRPQG